MTAMDKLSRKWKDCLNVYFYHIFSTSSKKILTVRLPLLIYIFEAQLSYSLSTL